MCAYRRSPVHSTFEVVVDLVESMAEVCALFVCAPLPFARGQ